MGIVGAGFSMSPAGLSRSAVAQAVAGAKNVGVGGANITQQCLQAGRPAELSIDRVPILLGQGSPLFRYLGVEPGRLATRNVRPAPGVAHLTFRVVQ